MTQRDDLPAPPSVRSPTPQRVIVASLIGTRSSGTTSSSTAPPPRWSSTSSSSPTSTRRRHAAGVRDLRRRVHRPPARRHRLRALRRPRRPQAGAGRHAADHGRRDVPHRPAADLRDDRGRGADPAGRVCGSSRAWASAASGAARCSCRWSTAPRTAAGSTRASPQIGVPVGTSAAGRPRLLNVVLSERGVPAPGAGACRSCCPGRSCSSASGSV